MVLDQFLELHKLEAKNGESVELWMALWTMGYNHNLQRDESFDFKVSTWCNKKIDPFLTNLPPFKLFSQDILNIFDR